MLDDGKSVSERAIERSFRENPDILSYSPKKLAEWFYQEGKLYLSNANEAQRQKFTHYVKHLTADQKKAADDSWKKMVK